MGSRWKLVKILKKFNAKSINTWYNRDVTVIHVKNVIGNNYWEKSNLKNAILGQL